MAQSDAFYEEIHTVPTAVVDTKSPFKGTGHWYLIHPLSLRRAETFSNLVLFDVKKWIEGSEHLYIGTSDQAKAFKEKRKETLELVKKVLKKRGVIKELDDIEGYLGGWKEESGETDLEANQEDLCIFEGTNDWVMVETPDIFNTIRP